MKVLVECYAGHKADQEPRAFLWQGTRRRVVAIADRWYDPSGEAFKVRADDGHLYLLRRDLEADEWSLTLLSRTQA